jgi:hypothetical protein
MNQKIYKNNPVLPKNLTLETNSNNKKLIKLRKRGVDHLTKSEESNRSKQIAVEAPKQKVSLDSKNKTFQNLK